MNKLPIDLKLRMVSTRVSVAAWERAHRLKKELGCSLQDVLSAALLYIDTDLLRRIMDSQKVALEELPPSVRLILKDFDKLTPEDRQVIRDLIQE